MTRGTWAVALLSLVSLSIFASQDAVGQTAGGYQEMTSLLTAGQCEVFGRRGLIDEATRNACCRAYNVSCPEGMQGGFGGGASQSQGFGGDSQTQSAVDAINALGGGRTAGAETGAPQGSNVGRNQNTRTPEQDYAVKTNPYFFDDKSKYPQ